MYEYIQAKLEAIGIMPGSTTLSRLDIKVNGRPLIKKNSKNIFKNKHTGRVFLGPNKVYAENIDSVYQQILMAKAQFPHPSLLPIKDNMVVGYEFHFSDNRLPDVSNVIEYINDAMQKCGIIENDKQIASLLTPIRVLNSEWTGAIVTLFWSKDIKVASGKIVKPKKIKTKKEKV